VDSHPLYDPVRTCTACDLHTKCKAPTPGVGSPGSRVMLVGEAPGATEDESGIPFTGKTGRYLDALLGDIGLPRSQVYITNTTKCRPLRNRTPTPAEAAFCGNRWLDIEIGMVRPQVVVTLGASATRYFTGADEPMEYISGIPRPFVWHGHGFTLLPIYHPAYGLRQTTKIADIKAGFDVLRRLLDGEGADTLLVKDTHPYPTYAELANFDPAPAGPVVAIDTETVGDKLWSAQLSFNPGEAVFVRNWDDSLIAGAHVVVHNYLYDANYVPIPPGNFSDTMLMAYLLGLPLSLKTLARTLCGMDMHSYTDITRPYRRDVALAYLHEAAIRIWPSPQPVDESVWDNKTAKLVTKTRKPQAIDRKIKRILADAVTKNADPFERWHTIPATERAVVEADLGPMREADLGDVPPDEAINYACRDADATLRVYRVLRPMISQAGLDYVLQVDQAALYSIRAMMDNGMAIDADMLRGYSKTLDTELGVEAAAVAREGGVAINPNSDQQTAFLLYQHLGWVPTRKTSTDRDAAASSDIKKVNHPVVGHILKYRELAKVKEFADKLPRFSQAGRVHGRINPANTRTGRLSMSDPNLMQIPVRTPAGRKIREAFVAEAGRTLLAIDYSQIEMRVKAHLANCAGMIKLFQEGRDIHTETSAQIHGLSLEDAAQDRYRHPVKTLGFGVVYGISAQGLLDNVVDSGIEGWDLVKCQTFINDYFKLYPEVQAHNDETVALARRHGYVTDMLGRRRLIPELSCPITSIQAAGKRQAINMPVQSSAQGIIKAAMGRIWGMCQCAGTGYSPACLHNMARWLLQVHDELIWEVEDAHLDTISKAYSTLMSTVVALSVPVLVTSKTGRTWGSML
jgi:uracil-DNA glycosylase family 4